MGPGTTQTDGSHTRARVAVRHTRSTVYTALRAKRSILKALQLDRSPLAWCGRTHTAAHTRRTYTPANGPCTSRTPGALEPCASQLRDAARARGTYRLHAARARCGSRSRIGCNIDPRRLRRRTLPHVPARQQRSSAPASKSQLNATRTETRGESRSHIEIFKSQLNVTRLASYVLAAHVALAQRPAT